MPTAHETAMTLVTIAANITDPSKTQETVSRTIGQDLVEYGRSIVGDDADEVTNLRVLLDYLQQVTVELTGFAVIIALAYSSIAVIPMPDVLFMLSQVNLGGDDPEAPPE